MAYASRTHSKIAAFCEAWELHSSLGVTGAMVSTDSSTSSGGAKRSKLSTCKAQGCTADLSDAGKYCLKKRLCPRHLRADTLRLTDQGETLFRSCRSSLAKRRISHADDDTAAALAQPIHACQQQQQQQQQSHVDLMMHSSSSLCSSLDTCTGATLAATHDGAAANTMYLPVMTAPAAAQAAWSADAAGAALAEECILPYQSYTGTAAAAACSAPAAALSRSYLQQRLQELTVQCAQLSQMYNELVSSQSQIQSAAAAVCGADVLTCWEGYL
ncbi:hypothetical protein OEZ85_012467 [Tetradesmus obliquus]|uniref:SBP-type domain-containing protein n=1 Tax=Tetradesmus obliquus TaxID=3088 RepID=A0ABY8TTG8_TETOB|nr:hypothetical protein OEZ85_012467 [Tetradesmus obliquus]